MCQKCAVVSGAKSDATYTCTSAADSRVSACADSSTTKKTVGAAGATDTCTATCPANTNDNSNANVCVPDAAVTCATTGGGAACPSTTTAVSSTLFFYCYQFESVDRSFFSVN